MIPSRYFSSSGREWARGQVLSLSWAKCPVCAGTGGLPLPKASPTLRAQIDALAIPDSTRICPCVYRQAFRKYLARYEKNKAAQLSGNTGATPHNLQYVRNEEDFIVDFELAARRHLSPEDFSLFKLSVVQGLDWIYCARKHRLSPEEARAASLRIQESFGCVIHELQTMPQPRPDRTIHPKPLRINL